MNNLLRFRVARTGARAAFGLAAVLCTAGRVHAEGRIGVNFTDLSNSSDHLAGTDVAGVPGFVQGHWNNVDGTHGTRTDLVDEQGIPVGGGFSVSWGCGNTWRVVDGTGTPDRKLLKGYLDDTSNAPDPGPLVDVSDVPFTLYDVVLYLSSDTPVNWDYGAYFLTDPAGTEITARVFGGDIRPFTGTYQRIPSNSTNPAVADPGGNYIVFEGLSLEGFRVIGDRTSTSRASLAGIQVVENLLPRIWSFDADPPTVDPGEACRLHWSVTHETGLTLDGADVTGLTETHVNPLASTTYTLVASNAEGSRTARVAVAVRDLRPVIDTFVADPPAVDLGRASTLRWNVSDADTLALNGIDVTGAAAYPVMPAVSTDYALVASNDAGTRTASVSVVVVEGVDHPVISEFVAFNDTTLLDEDGDASDWIEIHNPTDVPVDLARYALTEDLALVERWLLPSVVVPPHGYLVVFASGKDRTEGPLHTDFRLSGAGEFLALLGPAGQVLHAFWPAFPSQQTDVSYGILGSDVTETLFMGEPTPGAANLLTPPPAMPVLFSLPDQVFTNATLLLTLSTATPAGEIRYTVDGTAPSATYGALYEAAIPIADSTLVRAVAYSAACTPGPIGVGHYVKLGADVQGFSSPLPILVVDNFGAGAIPTKGFNQTMQGIVQQARQGAGLMFYDRDPGGVARFTHEAALTTRAGIRVRGSYSSTFPRPPYSVKAWDGDDREVDIAPLGLPPESDWILYRPKEDIDVTLMYNTWIFEVSNQIGHYAVRTRFVEGFVHTGGGELTMADHAGVYVLMEKVKRDPHRIGFERFAPDGSTGGWLLAINRLDPIPVGGEGTPRHFHTAGQNRIQETPPDNFGRGDDEPRQYNAFINFEHPNGYDILPAQRAAIEGWFVPFEDALWSPNYTDPEIGYRRYLDTADFIDYYILHNITKNGDGLLLSMWLYLEHPDARLKMGPVWDYDLLAYRGDPASDLLHHADRLWYRRMFTDVDFTQEYIDRWQLHRRGGLATSNLLAIIDRGAAEITEPVAAAHGVVNWAGRLASWRNWITARCAAIDAQFVPAPQFSHPGGEVASGFQVTLHASQATVYLTLDGSDPRAPGGGIAPSAQPYQGPLGIHGPTYVEARAYAGGAWSGPVRNEFFSGVVEANGQNLVISEINYDPRPLASAESAAGVTNAQDFEFLEVLNVGPQTVRLEGAAFTDGVQFNFTDGAVHFLAPGDYAVLAGNPTTFGIRHPDTPARCIAGAFTMGSRLSNEGEQLTLWAPAGLVRAFSYGVTPPWPTAPLGQGRSLTLIGPDRNPDPADPESWRSSLRPDGTPGYSDAFSYPAWKDLHGIVSDDEDGDGDGLNSVAEYAHGTHPALPDAAAAALDLSLAPVTLGGYEDTYFLTHFLFSLAADDVEFQVEQSTDLRSGDWRSGAGTIDYAGEQLHPDGTATRSYRAHFPAAAYDNLYLRLSTTPR